MTEPTDADRVTAGKALGYEGWPYAEMAEGPRFDVDAVAAALAAEREKARAPFLALADGMQSEADKLGDHEGLRVYLTAKTFAFAADRIRRAAENAP